MTLQMVLVLAITVIVFSGFIRERQPPDVTALLGVCLLLIFGALSADEFLSVFPTVRRLRLAPCSCSPRPSKKPG